jgi:hypothetical protein
LLLSVTLMLRCSTGAGASLGVPLSAMLTANQNIDKRMRRLLLLGIPEIDMTCQCSSRSGEVAYKVKGISMPKQEI